MVLGNESALGSQLPGTKYILSPTKAAQAMGLMFKWSVPGTNATMAYKDSTSSRLGCILALVDSEARRRRSHRSRMSSGIPKVRDVLHALIKAKEIETYVSLSTRSCEKMLSPEAIAEIATVATLCKMLDLSPQATSTAVAKSWADGLSDIHAHAVSKNMPTAAHKESALCFRAVDIVQRAQRGQLPYAALPSIEGQLYKHAPTLGLAEVLGKRAPLAMENVLMTSRIPGKNMPS